MIKPILFAGATLLLSTSVRAQDNFEGEIKWGEPFQMKRKEIGPNPIGSINGSFYSTKSKRSALSYSGNLQLMTFNLETLALQAEDEIDLEYGDFNLTLINSFIFGDKVAFITQYTDKKAKKKHYLLHELEGGTSLGKPIELAEVGWSPNKLISTKKSRETSKNTGEFSFRLLISDDHESMMISYENEATSGTQTILLDKNFNEVGRGVIDVPYEEFGVVEGRLSNTGRFYSVGYEVEKDESTGLIKREIDVAGDYHVLIYNAVNGELEDFDLNIEREIVSVGIKILEDESFVAYGMYSNDDATGVSGAYFMKVDKERNVNYTERDEFAEDFITQHWTARQLRKAEKKKTRKNPKKQAEPSLYSYIMHDLVVKDNGDMVLLAEQYYMYVTSHTYTDANGISHTSYTYHYIYNDILAVNCTSEGVITWKNKVKKRQHSTNDGGKYSSFFTLFQGDNIMMIYNDSEANMDETDEEDKKKRKVKRNTVAAIITLESDGEISRKTFFDFENDEKRTLVPKMCEKMSENEMLLYTQASKKGRILGWVTL